MHPKPLVNAIFYGDLKQPKQTKANQCKWAEKATQKQRCKGKHGGAKVCRRIQGGVRELIGVQVGAGGAVGGRPCIPLHPQASVVYSIF